MKAKYQNKVAVFHNKHSLGLFEILLSWRLHAPNVKHVCTAEKGKVLRGHFKSDNIPLQPACALLVENHRS